MPLHGGPFSCSHYLLSSYASMHRRLTKVSLTEESQNQKQMYETRIAQLEKERDQLTHEIETLNKKLQMQQRQLENLQKQATGVCLNHC